VFPVQQQQTTPKPFVNPSVSNVYPTNPVAKPSVPQPFTSTVAPPRPFSPATAVPGVSQPHGGYANTNQPNIASPIVTTQPGKFVVFLMCMCWSAFSAVWRYSDVSLLVCEKVAKNLLEYYIMVFLQKSFFQ
jgi:hypothetical protein